MITDPDFWVFNPAPLAILMLIFFDEGSRFVGGTVLHQDTFLRSTTFKSLAWYFRTFYSKCILIINDSASSIVGFPGYHLIISDVVLILKIVIFHVTAFIMILPIFMNTWRKRLFFIILLDRIETSRILLLLLLRRGMVLDMRRGLARVVKTELFAALRVAHGIIGSSPLVLSLSSHDWPFKCIFNIKLTTLLFLIHQRITCWFFLENLDNCQWTFVELKEFKVISSQEEYKNSCDNGRDDRYQQWYTSARVVRRILRVAYEQNNGRTGVFAQWRVSKFLAQILESEGKGQCMQNPREG